jgi:hypothetical protein
VRVFFWPFTFHQRTFVAFVFFSPFVFSLTREQQVARPTSSRHSRSLYFSSAPAGASSIAPSPRAGLHAACVSQAPAGAPSIAPSLRAGLHAACVSQAPAGAPCHRTDPRRPLPGLGVRIRSLTPRSRVGLFNIAAAAAGRIHFSGRPPNRPHRLEDPFDRLRAGSPPPPEGEELSTILRGIYFLCQRTFVAFVLLAPFVFSLTREQQVARPTSLRHSRSLFSGLSSTRRSRGHPSRSSAAGLRRRY